MSTLDGYSKAKKGKAKQALGILAAASFVGATVATLGLTFFAPYLAKAAIYFALYVMAFATIGDVAGVNPIKTLLAAFIGLMLASVGLDPATGTARFTFGSYNLHDGFEPIVSIVGLFTISEILMYFERIADEGGEAAPLDRGLPNLQEPFALFPASLCGSVIGFICGVLPRAAASLGAFVSDSVEKQVSDKDGTFGTGDPRGIAAPEAGNNAASRGALIPMLTLGVPCSGSTAVMLALGCWAMRCASSTTRCCCWGRIWKTTCVAPCRFRDSGSQVSRAGNLCADGRDIVSDSGYGAPADWQSSKLTLRRTTQKNDAPLAKGAHRFGTRGSEGHALGMIPSARKRSKRSKKAVSVAT